MTPTHAVSAHVLLLDSNRSRRHLLAAAFRAAGCVVVETGQEHEVTRTLASNAKSWVLAVADSILTHAFCDAHPGVPIVRIGGDHELTIAGRITISTNPDLASEVHGLVASRAGVN